MEAFLELKTLLQEPRMKVAAVLDGRQITRPVHECPCCECVSVEVVESTPKVVSGVYRVCDSLV